MAQVWELLSAPESVLDDMMALAASGDEDGPWFEDPRLMGLHDRVDETLLLGEEWHTLYVLLTGVRWDAPPPLGHVLLGTPALGRVVLGDGPREGMPVYEDEELAEREVVPAAKLTPGRCRRWPGRSARSTRRPSQRGSTRPG